MTPEPSIQVDSVQAGPGHAGVILAFAVLAVANLGAAIYLNTHVLTDEVYRSILSGQGSSAQVDALLALTRRWERLGYVLSPLTLFLRVGCLALFVQLALVLMGPHIRLARVFRAATLAHFAPTLGVIAQIVWLATLPASARTGDELQTTLGSLAGLIISSNQLGPNLTLLLERVTLFDVGWMVLFILALEDAETLPALDAAAAVVSVWILMIASQWGLWIYLEAMA